MGTQHVLSILDEAGEVRLKAVAGSGGGDAYWHGLLEEVRAMQVRHRETGGVCGEMLFAHLAPMSRGSLVVQEVRGGRMMLLGHEDAAEGEWMDSLAEHEENLAFPYFSEETRERYRSEAEWGYMSIDKFRQRDWNPRWRHGTAARTAYITHDGLLFTTDELDLED